MTGDQIWAYAVGVRRYNHHVTSYSWDPNCTVYFMPVPQSRTDLGHISLSSPCTMHSFLCPSWPLNFPTFSHVSLLGWQSWRISPIVRQLPTKASWWDAPLPLCDLAVSNLHIFFSVLHAPTFSCIYPLGGQGRQVWQTVRQLPIKVGWWSAFLVLQDSPMSNLHIWQIVRQLAMKAGSCFPRALGFSHEQSA